jgi:coenzyme F420-reducing hydrogenase beta subunit
MIGIENKEQCCGCEACVQVCPRKCISFNMDNEGFGYPKVNESECVKCGSCVKACPIINAKKPSDEIKKAYIGYIKDEKIRAVSSSGGLFTAFAEYIIARNGAVYGAAFDKNFTAHHICVESSDDLGKLRGSKYIQSRINTSYIEAKEQLEQGRLVLFTGTACQIAGLKRFLGKEYDGLYTIDLLCHGVPSEKVWLRYTNELEKKHNAHIVSVYQKSKLSGWRDSTFEIIFGNGDSERSVSSKNGFMRLFLSDICLRPSCHACRFKSLKRDADITIGDCWRIRDFDAEMDDDKGISNIIIHSEKGQRLFENISHLLNYKEADVDVALPKRSLSRISVARHRNRDKFFKKLNKGKSTDELLKLLKKNIIRRIVGKSKRIIKNRINL